MKPKLNILLAIVFFAIIYSGRGQVPCVDYFSCGCPCNISVISPGFTGTVNIGEPVTFNFIGSGCPSDIISFGDGCGTDVDYYTQLNGFSMSGPGGNPVPNSVLQQSYITYTYGKCGTFLVRVIRENILCTVPVTVVGCLGDDETPVQCEKAFAPTPGDYILSFWVKEDRSSMTSIGTYVSGIDLAVTSAYFGVSTISVYANGAFNSQNKIIDGWQKVEQKITLPQDLTDFNITLTNNAGTGIDCYFDDIRFQPFNSTLKSYVYDPVTLRLSAELDERNYATFYEYDEEGRLIRIKKETERGIKTIKESRTSVTK